MLILAHNIHTDVDDFFIYPTLAIIMSQRKQYCRYHRLIKTNIYTDGRCMNVNISYSAGSIRDKTRAHTSKYYRQTTGQLCM